MELVQTFNQTLNDFIFNLKKFYPEETKDVTNIVDQDDTLPLQFFMTNILPVVDKISDNDDTIFNEDFFPVRDCNLSIIWKNSSKKANREAIWKFLQTLTLLGNTIKSKSSNLEHFFEQFENIGNLEENNISKQMFEIFQSLTEKNNEFDISEDDVTNENTNHSKDTDNEENDDSENDNDDDPQQYAKMFENTKIGNLADEIAKDIDLSEFDNMNMESPDIKSIMEKLVGGGGLTRLIKTVATKLKSKFDTGAVKQEDLVNEVTHMMDKMKGDKKFKKMFKNKNMQDMMKEFMKSQGGMSDMTDSNGDENTENEDFSSLEEMFAKQMNSIPKNAKINTNAIKENKRKLSTKERLRKKLEARKNITSSDI